MNVLKALIVWINVGAEANKWKSSKVLKINVVCFHKNKEGKRMDPGWEGFWIGMRGTGKRGRTFNKVETRSILFKQKNSHTHFFPAENSSKILSKKFV